MAIIYNENGSKEIRNGNKKKNTIALNDGPSTPIKYDSGMGKYMPNLGVGRVNDDKIRRKFKIPKA